ncbi:amino-acid N-acetyltransferase [Spirochaeta lutea]|uniref:amino-acid N-acetyltransferase n=1 Tax=Spirochaeta lutea TaxID=1480694 RepID=UPI000691A62A|nr:amino-acid N-acetyltransferase [Spirochaeta lutea]
MEESILQGQVDLIREVFMYAQRFFDKRFVIMISSAIIDDPRFPSLVRDLGILHKSGIQILLVPGAGRHIDDVLEAYGHESRRHLGVRISAREDMPFIKMAAFDVANKLMTQLSSLHVDSVIGSWVRARSIGVVDGVDYQETGAVSKIDVRLLEKVLEDGMVPILPCIGWSATGNPYNISSLELATYLAEQLKAEKLFFLTDSVELSADRYRLPEEGVVTNAGNITRLSVPAAREFLELNTQLTETLDYLFIDLAARAASNGVERVHIINGSIEGVILKEIFSTMGFGTMVHSDPFESIRDMQADDIPGVLDIMEPNIQKGILVRRDQQELERLHQDFVVYITDGSVRGCGALHRYEDNSAEIAGIAVDPGFSTKGIGQKIVSYLIGKARRLGLERVFVLTTKTSDWFENLGFIQAGPADLPESKQKKYDPNRRSRVFVYPLQDDVLPESLEDEQDPDQGYTMTQAEYADRLYNINTGYEEVDPDPPLGMLEEQLAHRAGTDEDSADGKERENGDASKGDASKGDAGS